MNNSVIYYSVGPLLYCPADHPGVASSLISGSFGKGFSLAFCLEDTIRDNCVPEAEARLIATLKEISDAALQQDFFMPKIFIRVREPDQIPRLFSQMGDLKQLICGFALPKFSLSNADAYIQAIAGINNGPRTFYMMPILEDASMVHLIRRYDILYGLKEKLDQAGPLVLNVRVGGNDLCHVFGVRRHAVETIYDIRPVAQILTDIFTVFGPDYVVSGPVWEYYDGPDWETGLDRELELDRQTGFVGKTIIHPKQIPSVLEHYKVRFSDYEDARAILNWQPATSNLVSGNPSGERMNEQKTHTRWAQKILYEAQVYGIQKPGRFRSEPLSLHVQQTG